ncbi:MAG: nucleotide exchange factor GrpE [Bacteroidales bacterium]|nr:nucleotide exchange factor GrpE [Bacteroidales bacterium]
MNTKEQEKIQEEILKADEEATAAQQQATEKTETEAQAEEGQPADDKQADCESQEEADELSKAQQEIADLRDKYLRLSAEFDNYRKRTLKEKAELILNGSEKCVTSILPILDDLERALKNIPSDEAREGVELIYNKFIKVLEQNGVKAIETEGLALDTDYHDAIAIVPAPTEELKGKIMDCTLKGYVLNEKVIRHAQVVVGQ